MGHFFSYLNFLVVADMHFLFSITLIAIILAVILICIANEDKIKFFQKIEERRLEREREEEERERKKIEGFKHFIKNSKQHFSFNHIGVAVFDRRAFFPGLKGLTEESCYFVAEGRYDSYSNVCYIYSDGKEKFKIYNKGGFSQLHNAIKLGKVNGLLEFRLGGNFQLRVDDFDTINYCTIIFHCTLPKVERVKQIYTTNNSITKEERAKQLCNSYNATDRDKGMDVSENVDVPYILRHVFGSTCKCTYCGETNWRLLGCDRINNNRPHSQDNIVVSCRNCNIERSNKYSVTEFKRIKQKEMHELGLN